MLMQTIWKFWKNMYNKFSYLPLTLTTWIFMLLFVLHSSSYTIFTLQILLIFSYFSYITKNFNDYCHFIIKECHNLCNYFPVMGYFQLVFIFPCYFCIISSWIWDYVFRIDSQKWNNRNEPFQTLKAMPGCFPKWL